MNSYRHMVFDCGIYNSAASQFHNQVISDFMFAHIPLAYLTKRRARTNCVNYLFSLFVMVGSLETFTDIPEHKASRSILSSIS
jgi:hypothetical protein